MEAAKNAGDSDLSVGSALCVSCGICCEGVLHDHAIAYDGEDALLADLGIPRFTKRDYPAFVLPCPCLRDRACTVYERRPQTCRSYRCNLLTAVEEGDTPAETAHNVVGHVRVLMTRIYESIGPRDTTQQIWKQARDYLYARWKSVPDNETYRRDNAALLLDLNVLALLCGRHFEPSNFEGTWSWNEVERGPDRDAAMAPTA